jgi:hypothetical protein
LFGVPCCKGDILAENILDDLEVGCQESEKVAKGFVTGWCLMKPLYQIEPQFCDSDGGSSGLGGFSGFGDVGVSGLLFLACLGGVDLVVTLFLRCGSFLTRVNFSVSVVAASSLNVSLEAVVLLVLAAGFLFFGVGSYSVTLRWGWFCGSCFCCSIISSVWGKFSCSLGAFWVCRWARGRMRLVPAWSSGVMHLVSAVVPINVGGSLLMSLPIGGKEKFVCRLPLVSLSFAGAAFVCLVFSPRHGDE